MLAARSLVFNVLYYLNLIAWMIAALPSLILPRPVFMWIARQWASSALWLLKAVCGTRMEVAGAERIPPGGFLVAAKHQSMWETFAFFKVFDDPAFILKRELMWIPFFGWYAWKAGSIPVRRGGGAAVLIEMNEKAREAVRQGRQVVIFPEGTRRAPGAPPAYKYGIAHMYSQIGAACVPVALNSGIFWPRRKFLRRPGTVTVEILDPLPPLLGREAFFARLQEDVETASNRLLGRADR